MIDPKRLRAFVAVSDHLHFGRAAAALGIAQPPLSRTIQALEEELGVALFARTKRTVKLTAAGEALLPEARRLLRELDALVATARETASGQRGTVALGFLSFAAYNVVPDLLREFRRRNPGVRLTLQEATSDMQLAGLRAGELDAGLVLPPVQDPVVEYLPLFNEPLVVALPAERSARARGRVALKSLAQSPFILFPRRSAPGLHDLIVSFCQRAGFRPRVEQEAIQMQTIVSLVAAGLGIALVPASLQNLRRTGVAYRALVERSPRVEIGLAWRADNESPALERFIGAARTLYARGQARRTL